MPKVKYDERTEPILEARRYLKNAKDILSEKGEKEDGYYNDPKYVRMAGNTAWNGILIAVEALTNAKSKTKTRVSIEDYKAYAKKFADIKYINYLNNLYLFMHLNMGYDGFSEYSMINKSFQIADEFLTKIDNKLKSKK